MDTQTEKVDIFLVSEFDVNGEWPVIHAYHLIPANGLTEQDMKDLESLEGIICGDATYNGAQRRAVDRISEMERRVPNRVTLKPLRENFNIVGSVTIFSI